LIRDVSQRALIGHHGAVAAGLAGALAAAVLLAGCGGGGGSGTSATTSGSGGGPATSTTGAGTTTGSGSTNPFGGGAAKGHTVSDALDAVLTSGDPKEACSTDFVTEQYLTSAYGDEQGCAKAVTPKSAAQSVDIQGLEGGSGQSGTATVKVLAHGGVYDGEKITVTLVKDGQDWKVDSLKSNAPVGP
jgi:hypothetical protein